jgi:hypothetical protein
MNTIKLITGTLSAMGAKPTTGTDGDGNAIIKVNAPTPKAEGIK